MSPTLAYWLAGIAVTIFGGLLVMILGLVGLVYKRLVEDSKAVDSRLSSGQSKHSQRDTEVYGTLRNHSERLVVLEYAHAPPNHGHPAPAE